MLRTAAKCIIQPRNFVKNNNSNSKNFIQRNYHFSHRQDGRSTNNIRLGATQRIAMRLSTFHQSTNGSDEFLPLAGITLVGAASLFGYNYTNNTLMEEEVKIEETKGDSSNEPTRMYTRNEILYSQESKDIRNLADQLQEHFLLTLNNYIDTTKKEGWNGIKWERDQGVHGGGIRYQQVNSELFHRATINVSGVHYEDKERYPIDSATALSVILHPKNPYAPSMHFHISYVETRSAEKENYWRMIADLNPSISNVNDTEKFESNFKTINHMTPELLDDALEFGNMYFYIPALKRHRGTSHLFIGNLSSQDMSKENGKELAEDLAKKTIKRYASIVKNAIAAHPSNSLTVTDYEQQLYFHTVYFFQVLTLDRGTTHGLLAHSDNDVGTLGSLPNFVDKKLLSKWKELIDSDVQQQLLQQIIDLLPDDEIKNGVKGNVVDDNLRSKIANVVRKHYRGNRGATSKQANLNLKWWEEQRNKRLSN